ncbi:hypothetical protein [Blastopirellula marina]|uniref:Uncharacterized protein n=1 Tax=Blastopirellula marina TaxID=124 RepID=A0A2S8GNU8_9BACT|nr:hypothetical protein [Blastopirellula marina]PQO46098.1 hypothetical protein C5Y93_11015 [Blastopirellula marina]
MTQNPYPRLVELARQVNVPDELCDVTPATDRDELAKVVAANRPILEEVRGCLTSECSVPVRYEKDYRDEHLSDIRDIRHLARAIFMAGNLDQIDQQWADAVQAGIDLLWLGCVTRRGGLGLDMLVATALTGCGMDILRKVRAQLDQTQRSQLIAVLPQVEGAIEPLEVIDARERDWEIAVEYEEEPFDVDQWLEELEQDESLTEEERQTVRSHMMEKLENLGGDETVGIQLSQLEIDRRFAAKFRMLTIDLALRTYHRAMDEYPHKLEKLATTVLPEVPLDPFTGKPFLYHWMPHDFQLSSPGPTGVDSKVLGPWPMVSQGRANLCLDEGDFYEE